MLPTTEDINAAFVTDNSLEQQEYSAAAVSEEELSGANGNGNNEFETNMSEENNNNNENNFDDNIDNVENVQVEHTIENNENTEEELNDNLNESSSSNNADDVSDKEQEINENNDDDIVDAHKGNDADIEIVNMKKKKPNYSAAIRNKEREGESSSDDEDANVKSAEMHPEFNKEWDYLDKPTNEKNDFNNAIDGYYALPIDLSNDIAVNYAPNLPINPDAEFIDVNLLQHSSNSAPQFEKLSLNYQPPSAEEWTNTPTK